MIRILLYKNKGFISNVIRWQTRGPYSHCAIWVDGRIYEAKEFTETLVRDAENSDFSSSVDWFKLNRKAYNKASQKDLEEFANNQIGKSYDYTMVLRFLTRRQETRKSKGKWFCSEFVFAAMKVAGVALFARTEPWEVSPNLLAKSPLLSKAVFRR